METGESVARESALRRVVRVEVPLLFQMVEWALLVGVARYLGERFDLAVFNLVAVVLGALMVAYAALAGPVRRPIGLSAVVVLLGLALPGLAWETAGLLVTLQAQVTI